MNEQVATHRLICDDCLKVIAHYSFKTTERAFIEQLGVFRCPECDEKISNKERLP